MDARLTDAMYIVYFKSIKSKGKQLDRKEIRL